MGFPPNGLISQGLTINGQSVPDPTIQAATGSGDAAITENLENSYATAADVTAPDNTVTVNAVPVDPGGDTDQIVL